MTREICCEACNFPLGVKGMQAAKRIEDGTVQVPIISMAGRKGKGLMPRARYIHDQRTGGKGCGFVAQTMERLKSLLRRKKKEEPK